MKQCPRCSRTYTDDQLNFCLDDGEMLMAYGQQPNSYVDDSPPTVLLNEARVTNPANWPQSPPSAPPVQWQPQNLQNQPFGTSFVQSKDQTLPTVALVLGVFSMLLICCYGGIWLGVPAAIVGFMGLQNADRDPQKYGGRGLAIGGMVLGIVSFLIGIGIVLISIAAN